MSWHFYWASNYFAWDNCPWRLILCQTTVGHQSSAWGEQELIAYHLSSHQAESCVYKRHTALSLLLSRYLSPCNGRESKRSKVKTTRANGGQIKFLSGDPTQGLRHSVTSLQTWALCDCIIEESRIASKKLLTSKKTANLIIFLLVQPSLSEESWGALGGDGANIVHLETAHSSVGITSTRHLYPGQGAL